jgi:hypothetical protein
MRGMMMGMMMMTTTTSQPPRVYAAGAHQTVFACPAGTSVTNSNARATRIRLLRVKSLRGYKKTSTWTPPPLAARASATAETPLVPSAAAAATAAGTATAAPPAGCRRCRRRRRRRERHVAHEHPARGLAVREHERGVRLAQRGGRADNHLALLRRLADRRHGGVDLPDAAGLRGGEDLSIKSMLLLLLLLSSSSSSLLFHMWKKRKKTNKQRAGWYDAILIIAEKKSRNTCARCRPVADGCSHGVQNATQKKNKPATQTQQPNQ